MSQSWIAIGLMVCVLCFAMGFISGKERPGPHEADLEKGLAKWKKTASHEQERYQQAAAIARAVIAESHSRAHLAGAVPPQAP